MLRPPPSATKLLICVWHQFTHWRPPADVAVHIRRRFPEMNVVHLPTYENLPGDIPDTDIFVGWSLRPEQFLRARKLQWIHSTAAGVSQLMYPELRSSRVIVTNASGVHTIPIAEHTLGMLISLARRFPESLRHQQQHRWAQQEIWDAPLRPRELHGQTLLIVGFGAIGKDLARRVKPLGMKIIAVTRSGQGDTSLADETLPVSHINEILHHADYVVIAAPDTPETTRMIGARQLAAMKPTAYLINVSRGTLIDEPALIDTLQRRAIAGAALDVATEEPLPADSPLWDLDNVFITPHTSGVSEFLWDRQTELLLDNLDRWFSHRPLINQVDLARGY